MRNVLGFSWLHKLKKTKHVIQKELVLRDARFGSTVQTKTRSHRFSPTNCVEGTIVC